MRFVAGMVVVTMSLSFGACRPSAEVARMQIDRDMAQRRLATENSMQLYERGRKAQREGAADEAAKHFRAAVDAHSENIFAILALGEIEFEREHYYAAAEQFDRASRLAPARFEPRFNLGTVLEATGRYSDAIREYEAALRLSPDQIEVMENLARTYVISGEDGDHVRSLVQRALRSEDRPEWRRWLLTQMSRQPTTTEASDAAADAERMQGAPTGRSR